MEKRPGEATVPGPGPNRHLPVSHCSSQAGIFHRSAPGTKRLAEEGKNKEEGMGPEKGAQNSPISTQAMSSQPLPNQDQSMLTSAGICISSTAATGAWAWQ